MKRRKITDVSNIDFGVIQQGDVLFYKTDAIPESATKSESNVVQEGEHTGHAHRLDEEEQFAIYEENGNKYVETPELSLVDISHEEHKTIPLPKNSKFKIGIVREFNPIDESLRPVLD